MPPVNPYGRIPTPDPNRGRTPPPPVGRENAPPSPARAQPPAHRPGISSPLDPRPFFAPASGKPGDIPMPPGRPHDAVKAERTQDYLYEIREHYGRNDTQMIRDGVLPAFPTGSRPPDPGETAMLRDFGSRMLAHEQPHGNGGHGTSGFDRNVRNGEFNGTYHIGQDAQGNPHPRVHSFGYSAGGSTRLNDDLPQPPSMYPNYPKPTKYIHSHPTHPELDRILGRPHTTNQMPSPQDFYMAGGKYASHGADNYLVWGDQVVHYNGKGFEVTELNPSPLKGILPPAPPPQPINYPPPSPPTSPPPGGGSPPGGGPPPGHGATGT